MMSPVYRARAVQPGTAMTAHGDEVRRHGGAGPFFSSDAPSARRPGDADPGTEANLPTRYPTHRKQRGGGFLYRLFFCSRHLIFYLVDYNGVMSIGTLLAQVTVSLNIFLKVAYR
jgi:hypothetical protein